MANTNGKENLDPSDLYARKKQAFPTFSDEYIYHTKPSCKVEELSKGTILFERGDCTINFLWRSEEIYERTKTLEKYELNTKGLSAALIHLVEKVVRSPSHYELVSSLELDEKIDIDKIYDVFIVSGGPAGLSATVYATSEDLTVLLEQEVSGEQAGIS